MSWVVPRDSDTEIYMQGFLLVGEEIQYKYLWRSKGLGRDRWRQRGDADTTEASAHPEELWSYPALTQHGQVITLLTLTQVAPREWAWPWARPFSYAEGNFTPSIWGSEGSSGRGRGSRDGRQHPLHSLCYHACSRNEEQQLRDIK